MQSANECVRGYDRSSCLTRFKRLYGTGCIGRFFRIPPSPSSLSIPSLPPRDREVSYLSGGYRERARASLVIQHYGPGTIRINLVVRNPGCGGSAAASYITSEASGRKPAGKTVGRNSPSEISVVRCCKKKKEKKRALAYLFIGSIRATRARFYSVE